MKKNSLIIFFILLVFLVFSVVSFASAEGIINVSVPQSTLLIGEIPEYDGRAVIQIHEGIPDFYISQLKADEYLEFSALDKLGRTGPGFACLGKESLPLEERGIIGNIKPSGWHTIRYDDLIEDRYLYNRCHVIGYMLCSDNATPENLFTGTRYLNMSGMLQYENKVEKYIQNTGNHVLYRVSPIYSGAELVARGVQMEAYSIEDHGDGICYNVFVYNVQPGIQIDYATGDSWIANTDSTESLYLELQEDSSVDDSNTDLRDIPDSPSGSPGLAETQGITYILNTNTKRFHLPSCPSVDEMKPKYKKEFFGTRDEALSEGYVPCGRCKP